MAVVYCKREGCKHTLPPKRFKYCSPECAKIVQQHQLDMITTKRREARKAKPNPKCAIPECGKEFKPLSSSHKYCSDSCSLKGLQAAIDRQKQRRQKAKQEGK